MAVKFKSVTKHGRLEFLPGVSLAFKDKGAEEFFLKSGLAEKAAAADVVHTYEAGSVEVDPHTVFADGPKKGQKVLEA